jgi:UDP:flavonoid glycosyltransferase YjiC (YdhE family)
MAKKKILIFPFDLLSHYLRCITLAEQYSDFEVLFALSARYNLYVENAGYKSFPVESFDAEEVMQQAAEFKFTWLNYKDLKRVYCSQVQAIEEHSPALVISDTSPTLAMAAEKTNTTHISLMNAYMSKYYSCVRGVSRTHYSYQYLQKLPPVIARCITKIAEKAAFTSIHKPFRQLRKENSLSSKKYYLDELEGDENLICDSPSLFQLKNAPANYKVIGPLKYNNTNTESDLIETLPASSILICVCLGSSGNWSGLKFLEQSKYSFAKWIIAGDVTKQLQASHFIHRDFLNLDKILPHCRLLICHGGNGTIYEGLKHSKPMLFLTNHFEQEWNAQRLQDLGLGKIINDSAEEIIDAALNEFKTSRESR